MFLPSLPFMILGKAYEKISGDVAPKMTDRARAVLGAKIAGTDVPEAPEAAKKKTFREKVGSLVAGKELNANTNNAESKTNVDNSKAKPDTTKYRHIGTQSNNLNLDGQAQAELENKMTQLELENKMTQLENAKTTDIEKEQVEEILEEINRQKQ